MQKSKKYDIKRVTLSDIESKFSIDFFLEWRNSSDCIL